MKYTNLEKSKAAEKILDSKVAGKHVIPIKFETRGRQAVPVLMELKAVDPEKSDAKVAAQYDYNVDIGSEKNGLKCSMKTKTMSFIDQGGAEQLISMPVIDGEDPKALFQATHEIGKIFMALRTAVLLTAATNEAMVESSSFEPATGIVLADMLTSEGRMQASTIKDLIEKSELASNGKLNQAISNHQDKKMVARAAEAIGHTTLFNFVEGCKTLAKNYEEIVSKSGGYTVASSEAEPVVAQRREAPLEKVERTGISKKSYSELL